MRLNLLKMLCLPFASLVAACSPLGLANTAAKIYPLQVQRDLSYGDQARQNYDLYLPQMPSAKASATPVIIFFYGGSWNSGDKSGYEFVGRRLSSEGYIVAVANYRLYPQVTYPDFLVDSAKAVSAIQKQLQQTQYKAMQPASQVVLMGHSAGAYNAAMLALDDHWLAAERLDRRKVVKGWIGMAGPYDLYPIALKDVQPVFHHPNYPAQSNPIDFVTGVDDIPALLMAPSDDEVVSTERNTYALGKKLKDAGEKTKVVTVEGTSHATLVGTLSPILFFKGSSMVPIKAFIDSLE